MYIVVHKLGCIIKEALAIAVHDFLPCFFFTVSLECRVGTKDSNIGEKTHPEVLLVRVVWDL